MLTLLLPLAPGFSRVTGHPFKISYVGLQPGEGYTWLTAIAEICRVLAVCRGTISSLIADGSPRRAEARREKDKKIGVTRLKPGATGMKPTNGYRPDDV